MQADVMDSTSDFRLARSADGRNKTPTILALSSTEGETAIRATIQASGSEFDVFRALDRESLLAALRAGPTVAILTDEIKHLPTITDLKVSEMFCDVLVLFCLPQFDPRLMRKAAEAGCDDVVVMGDDGAELEFRLDAIWGYHKEYGFAPPSGHWYVFNEDREALSESGPSSDDQLAVHSLQMFAEASAPDAAHVLLVSDHPFYKIRGQDLLTRAGYNVSFVDSGFTAMRFLFDLARRRATKTPEFLQGKLDLILIALATSNEQSAQLVRKIKGEVDCAEVPVLLITDTKHGLEALRPYADKGVYATVDGAPQAEDVAFRIFEIFNSATPSGWYGRRHLFSGPCSYRAESDPTERWHHGMMYNLGREGIYVRTVSPPVAGEQVQINFRLRQDSFLLEFAGPVIWENKWRPASTQVYPAGFGVALLEGTASAFEALIDFCDLLGESETHPQKRVET